MVHVDIWKKAHVVSAWAREARPPRMSFICWVSRLPVTLVTISTVLSETITLKTIPWSQVGAPGNDTKYIGWIVCR